MFYKLEYWDKLRKIYVYDYGVWYVLKANSKICNNKKLLIVKVQLRFLANSYLVLIESINFY